jgi:hypothetical protein
LDDFLSGFIGDFLKERHGEYDADDEHKEEGDIEKIDCDLSA